MPTRHKFDLIVIQCVGLLFKGVLSKNNLVLLAELNQNKAWLFCLRNNQNQILLIFESVNLFCRKKFFHSKLDLGNTFSFFSANS